MLRKPVSLALIIFVLFTSQANAQFPYVFTAYTASYEPLSGATSINNNTVWTELNWYAVPIGFNFKIDTINTSLFSLQGAANIITDTNSDLVTTSSFILTDANLIDRGYGGSSSLSPMRYLVSGTAGSRIFKYEVFNSGFEGEYDSLHTLNDSVNMQVWFYEGSNIVELRYGPSKISHPNYYFINSGTHGKTAISYFQDMTASATGNAWILAGAPANPSIEDIQLNNGIPSSYPTCLSSFPDSGTVYRFAPIGLAVDNINQPGNVRVYPTFCDNELFVDYNNTGKAFYKIISITGRDMNVSGALNNGTNHIDIGNISPGMYLLFLQNENYQNTYKIIKK